MLNVKLDLSNLLTLGKKTFLLLSFSSLSMILNADESLLLKADIKENLIEQFLQKVLSASKEKIENTITKDENQSSNGPSNSLLKKIPKMTNVGATLEDCSPELVAQMSLAEAWKKCPGLPPSFLKMVEEKKASAKKEDKKGWGWGSFVPKILSDAVEIYNTAEKPIPMEVNIGGLSIGEVVLGNPIVHCAQELKTKEMSCKASFSLKQLSASLNFNMKSLYPVPDKGIKSAGEMILDLAPTEFEIASHRDSAPTLDLSFKLVPNKLGQAPFQLVAKETQLNIPSGSLTFKFPHGEERTSLNEVLTSGHLNFNPKILENSVVGLLGKCNSTLGDVCSILGNMENSLSELLNDPKKMNTLNKLINEHSGIAKSIENSIKDFDIFKDGVEISMPKARAQDLVDFLILKRVIDAYDKHLLEILAGKAGVSADQFQLDGETIKVENIISDIEMSKNSLLINKLEPLIQKHNKIIEEKINGFNLKDVKQLRDSMKDIVKKEEKSHTKKQKEKLAKIAIFLQNSNNGNNGNNGKYTLSIQDECGQSSKKKSVASTDNTLFSSNDMSVSINKESINNISNRLYTNGKFQLCIIKDTKIFIGRICEAQPESNTVKISAIDAPEIIFNGAENKVGIKIKLNLKDNGQSNEVNFNVMFDLNQKTALLNIDDAKKEDYKDILLQTSQSFLGLILSSFPILSKLGFSQSVINELLFNSNESNEGHNQLPEKNTTVEIIKDFSIVINENQLVIGANLVQ